MSWLRRHLTYANVVATLALVIAVGTGSAYAVDRFSGARLENRSVAGLKIKRNSLTGTEINESRLGTVPSARDVGGRTADELLVRCLGETLLEAGVCSELRARIPRTYLGAVNECNFNRDRHLPTHDELLALLNDPQAKVELASGGEFIRPAVPLPDGRLVIGVMTERGGKTEQVPALGLDERAFRCVTQRSN